MEDQKEGKEKKRKNDSTSSKIDWSGSSNRWIGRGRSRDWNRIRSVDYWIVTKPIIGSEKIPIHDYGIRIDGSNCVVRIDDGILDFVHFLIERKGRKVEPSGAKRKRSKDERKERAECSAVR